MSMAAISISFFVLLFSDLAILPHMRKAWEKGKYTRQEIELDGARISTRGTFLRIGDEDLAWGLASLDMVEDIDVGNAARTAWYEAL